MYGGLMQLIAYGAQDIYLNDYTTITINFDSLEYLKVKYNNNIPSDINNIILNYYINNKISKNIKNSENYNKIEIVIDINEIAVYKYLKYKLKIKNKNHRNIKVFKQYFKKDIEKQLILHKINNYKFK